MNTMQLTADSTDAALQEALRHLHEHGEEVRSRNGSALEATLTTLRLENPRKRESLLPSRKASLPAQIFETAWVLAGRNDIASLQRYLPRASQFSDDGETWRAGYGPRIRGAGAGVDQVAYVLRALTEDPGSRQAVISIYDPAVDSTSVRVKDRACNVALQFLIRGGRLHCNVFMRSNDAIWGFSGINAFEWSVLQEVLAHLLGVEVGVLQFNTTSFHLYGRHHKRSQRIVEDEPVERALALSPAFSKVGSLHRFDQLLQTWFEREREIRENADNPAVVASLYKDFPEPMLKSWLQVLAHHWTKDEAHLEGLEITRLRAAALLSAGVGSSAPSETSDPLEGFQEYVLRLHASKHQAYGDSWKRRGETLGILPNINRKIDRLGVSDDTETDADTAIDLLVYCCKYLAWFIDPEEAGTTTADKIFLQLANRYYLGNSTTIERIKSLGDQLDKAVLEKQRNRSEIVRRIARLAYPLAHRLWSAQAGDDYRGADHE